MSRRRSLWARTGPTTEIMTGWHESTLAETAWEKNRNAGRRWALIGALVGAMVALIVFAPAAWLASAVSSATHERFMLADARGTIWSGSAVVLVTGGKDSRDATALPGRMEWKLGLKGLGLQLRATHACCLNGTVSVLIRAGLGHLTATLNPPADWVGQWPSNWLTGLGTPWNTLQPQGMIRLSSPGLVLKRTQGHWNFEGRADIDLLDISSRISTLERLGSYRFSVSSTLNEPGIAQITLGTTDGALQLNGSGTWSSSGFRFRGEARASDTDEAALQNLLNIIGRREGARSVISIG
jgi:general secretion pathway protein N